MLDIKTAKAIDNERENIPRTKDINELLEKAIAAPATEEGKATKITDSKPAQKKDKADGGAFSDDFNAGPKPDWKPVSGNWTMSNGQYTVTDINPKETYTTFLDGMEFGNFTMDIDVSPGYTYSDLKGFYALYICPRFLSFQEKICFGMSGRNHKFNEAYWFIVKDGSNGEPTSKVSMETSEGKPVHVKIEVKDGVFTSYVNGTQTNQVYDTTFLTGSIGLSQWYEYWDARRIRITFDNLEIKPLAD